MFDPGWRIFGTICVHTWKKVARRPIVLVFSLVQPLMWMIFFGFLFHRYPVQAGEDAVAYLDFLLPGVCVMTVLFGASQSGTGLIRDLQTGFLKRMLLTPASPAALLAGKVSADVVRLLAQGLVVALMGLALGARLHPRFSALAAALVLTALFALGYASLSCWIALKTRSQETMGVFIQALNMPLFFTSTALVPKRHMPVWLAGIAAANPISAVADGLRFALLRIGEGVPWIQLAAGGACAFALFAVCLAELGKARRL
ncbi:MAG: type transporter [Fibrobacteres bacterium]|nr:type transporter [Fibrobacterota bacterium]